MVAFVGGIPIAMHRHQTKDSAMKTNAPDHLPTIELDHVNGGIDWQRWALLPRAVIGIAKYTWESAFAAANAPAGSRPVNE
jgi:hypothetical protein